jgi:hypothetical protein
MGAVRKRAVFWVAVLKRDPHAPGWANLGELHCNTLKGFKRN